ncbi:MAG: hypothetical protein WCO47_05280 [Methylococcus sp.]|jgi:hypothetical protein
MILWEIVAALADLPFSQEGIFYYFEETVMENQKDNFWVIIAGVILLAITLVVGMRSVRDGMESSVKDQSAQAESNAEVERALQRNHSQK